MFYIYFRLGDEKHRIRGCLENVIPGYTEEDFRKMFRMKPETFEILLGHLMTLPEIQPLGHGRRDPVSIEKQLQITHCI